MTNVLNGTLTPAVNLSGSFGSVMNNVDYTDLENKPQINGVTLSGNKTSAQLGIIIPTKTSDLTNDADFVPASDLATIAFSGSYNDLTNVPPITVQQNADWNSNSGVTKILNKPALKPVATSGAYSDLTGKPTIPTMTSQLINDSGYLTELEANSAEGTTYDNTGSGLEADNVQTAIDEVNAKFTTISTNEGAVNFYRTGNVVMISCSGGNYSTNASGTITDYVVPVGYRPVDWINIVESYYKDRLSINPTSGAVTIPARQNATLSLRFSVVYIGA